MNIIHFSQVSLSDSLLAFRQLYIIGREVYLVGEKKKGKEVQFKFELYQILLDDLLIKKPKERITARFFEINLRVFDRDFKLRNDLNFNSGNPKKYTQNWLTEQFNAYKTVVMKQFDPENGNPFNITKLKVD